MYNLRSIFLKCLTFILPLLFIVTGYSQTVFFNEVNYLDTDLLKGFEIAGPDGTDLDGWNVYKYDENGFVDGAAIPLSGVMTNAVGCADFIWVDVILSPIAGSGIALVDDLGGFVQYLTYGGISTTGMDGPAITEPSEEIGTQTDALNSLQLTGPLAGPANDYIFFDWDVPLGTTKDLVNTGQFPDFCLPLPVEWGAFTGKLNRQEQAQLNWQTLSESNTDYFLVEHSVDGKNFFPIGALKSALSSISVKDYTYIHDRPSVGSNYYRLKQVDLDDRYEYSSVIIISRSLGGAVIAYYPNPVQSTLHLDIDPSLQIHSIQIFDLTGNKLLDFDEKRNRIDVSHLQEGAYILQVTTREDVFSQALIVSKK